MGVDATDELEFEDRFEKDRFDVDPKDRWATAGEEGHGLLDMGKMMEGHRPVRRSQRVAKLSVRTLILAIIH